MRRPAVSPLNIAESPQADQERALIRAADRPRARPRTQIKAALVGEYGDDVIAAPKGGGFEVDRLARARALVVLARSAARGRSPALAPAPPAPTRRTRRRRDPAEPDEAPGSTRDLARYDLMMLARSSARRHDGLRRVRGRLRLVHLALRAAARPRLPVARSPASRSRDPRGEQRPMARSCGPAIIFCLSFTAMFVALGMTATGLGSHAAATTGTLDKIAGALIIALGVFFVRRRSSAAQQRVAAGRADASAPAPAARSSPARRSRSPGRRASARRSAPILTAARHAGRVGKGGVLLRVLLARAGRAVPAHRRRVRPRDERLPLAARPLPRDHRDLRRRAHRDGRAHLHPASSPASTARSRTLLGDVGLDFIYSI